ncbi:polyphosphate polymerase domain-containing protein [Clostridium butyricum]|uniref:polyphosphate polymerase domain-containing protein n=1 Tax=Clostridium butyricum TaxID=1492 RepID=UPI0013D3CCE5|nr:polyphosphate polymerase domain-containing protein [Clostridium butyricum]MCQ2015926.1 polyphosphate polymerase domain-containing protein [Clostridium butyricum]MCQ2019998.1 polyphosphate polymerase domain-containing protein [Clostridium butyricum]NFB70322.1 polyphosphate polymerase domain-containing protein [Clostridium butyricum]NFB90773.1 polyphosphate polymerase domain-containing protein [Clostridium butyricum]UTY51644.1 polyphosphate polymerase domain-containing protein [Clostridium bu
MAEDTKFRHELKHYINYSDYLAIKSRIRTIMHIDRNANSNNEYRIRSLYFDNVYDKALMEKVIGIPKRDKFRIRFYNDNHDFIRLEKKSKIRGLCLKDSERITKEEYLKIINGDIEFLKESGKKLFIDLYTQMKGNLLKPKTIVDYTREAYIYPIGNVRITFDKSIRTGLNCINMFDDNLPTIETVDHKFIVLEVKFDEFMPQVIHDIVQVNERRATSVSKYEAARIYG